MELLRKKDKWLSGKGEALTKEEFEYVSKLESEGLTDYQKRQREWDGEKKHFQKDIDKNNEEILSENAIIRGTKLERLKNAPMVKAQKEAEAILDATSKEIIGMIMEETKDTIDEKNKEEQEKAEKLEEKQKEQEAFIEKQKEKREENEELIENMPMEEMIIFLHAKIYAIDKEDESVIYIGSANFSQNGLEKNHELMCKIVSKECRFSKILRCGFEGNLEPCEISEDTGEEEFDSSEIPALNLDEDEIERLKKQMDEKLGAAQLTEIGRMLFGNTIDANAPLDSIIKAIVRGDSDTDEWKERTEQKRILISARAATGYYSDEIKNLVEELESI